MASPTSPKAAEGDTNPAATSPIAETASSPTAPSPKATLPDAPDLSASKTDDATTEAALAEAAQDHVPDNSSLPVAKTEPTAATAGSDAAPATETTSTAPPAAPPAAPPTEHADPKVAELHTMFPSVDVGVIEMVLESVGGSQDRAIESLLQMTDPDFKPDELSSARQEEAVELDAEFARAMALQDEEEARERQRRASAGGGGARHAQPERTPIPDVLPYQPRVRKPRRPQPDPYAGEHNTALHLQERYDPREDHMAHRGDDVPPGIIAFEEKMNSFAETGRQTFNSFMSRAKAKYAEYQAHQAASAEQRAREQALLEAQPGHAPRSGWGEGTTRPAAGGVSSRTISVGSQNSSTSSIGDAPAAMPAPSRRWNPADAYEDPVARPADRRSPAGLAAGAAASPDKAAAGKIDLAKLGFLPKKRVDLMSTSPQPPEDRDPNPHLPASPTTPTTTKQLVNKIPKTPPAEQSHHTLGDSDDDDDLDYTE